MTPRPVVCVLFVLLLEALLPVPSARSQSPDSSRYRIYITVTDSITGRSAKAALGFHPRATLGLEADTLFGFTDHWYEGDSSWMQEYPSPPLGFFEELRINNVRQKFLDHGLLFGNIHPYTGPSMVDTFIVSFNGDANTAGDSQYVYTHPQILSWPSVLKSYADSIILRDITSVAQTTAGTNVRVDMTKDSTWTYFGDRYFNADVGIWTVDPLRYGFFLYIYHPKIAPGPPGVVVLLSPANGSTGAPLNETLQWDVTIGAASYKVEVDSARTFSHPLLTHVVSATSDGVGPLAPNTWYYWRVSASNQFGVSYYQNPPDSFLTTSSAGVHETGPGVARSFALFQNYPNPFNPSTRMEFEVPRAAHIRITLYDGIGRSVATLVEGDFTPGVYSAAWDGAVEDGAAAPSGVYYARMLADPSLSGDRRGARAESIIRMVILK